MTAMTDVVPLLPVDGIVKVDGARILTAVRFQGLAEVPSELEWFANIDNKSTRRAYENGSVAISWRC